VTSVRAIWKGAVSFGLVSVPVRVYAATGRHDVPVHQVHAEDGGRIRYRKVCSVDGAEVEAREIAKGYETDGGGVVVLTDADLDALPVRSSHEIDVLEFVPAEQVDPLMFSTCYYLEPEKTAVKPYGLLRDALAASDRVAVVKVALRQRERLALLRVKDQVICLQTLLWPDEVREPAFAVLETEVELRPKEQQMAHALVESLAADFDPAAYTDEYTEALEGLINSKVEGGEVRAPGGGEEELAPPVDLMAALRASVERAQERRRTA
jgi:DNA end-binding protein Ku